MQRVDRMFSCSYRSLIVASFSTSLRRQVSRSIFSDSFSNSIGSVAIVTFFLDFTGFVAGLAAVETVGFRVLVLEKEEVLDVANTLAAVDMDTFG